MSLTICRSLESFRADFQIPWVFSPTGWCVTLDSNQQTIACTLMISAIMQTRLPRTFHRMFFSPVTHMKWRKGWDSNPRGTLKVPSRFRGGPVTASSVPFRIHNFISKFCFRTELSTITMATCNLW